MTKIHLINRYEAIIKDKDTLITELIEEKDQILATAKSA